VGGFTTHGLCVRLSNRSAHRRLEPEIPEIISVIPVSCLIFHGKMNNREPSLAQGERLPEKISVQILKRAYSSNSKPDDVDVDKTIPYPG